MIEAEIPVNAKIINKILTILSICSAEKKKTNRICSMPKKLHFKRYTVFHQNFVSFFYSQ